MGRAVRGGGEGAPKGSEAGGRPPIPLERMLRIYFLQLWFNLSDPAVEEALYDSVVKTDIGERVLNHARERIEATYDVHRYIDEKREALEKWARHLQNLCDDLNHQVKHDWGQR